MHPEIIAALQALAAKVFEHHPSVTNFNSSWGNNHAQINITTPSGAGSLNVGYGQTIEKPQ